MAVTAGPSRRTVEFVFAAALIAVAGAVFVLSADYPAESAAFPRVLAVLLALCAVLVAARQLRHRDEAGAQPFFLHLPRFLITLVALVAYVVAIDVTGYLLPSFALAVALPFVLGYRRLALTVPIAVGTLVLIVLVFNVALERPMPPDVLMHLWESVR